VRSTSSAPQLETVIRVHAAVSLARPFKDSATSFKREAGYPDGAPRLAVSFNFAGSQSIVTLVADGYPVDVVATADEASMAKLVAQDLVFPPVIFATNRIVIAVAKGNPKAITGLADLTKPGVSTVLADPSVPVGAYARQALDVAGVKLSPKSLELDTKATIGRVERGDVDAAIVYATDVKASTSTDAVSFSQADDIVARYPIAVVKGAEHRDAAEVFVTSARSGAVHDALLAAGFGSE